MRVQLHGRTLSPGAERNGVNRTTGCETPMLIAASYSFLDVLWDILIIFAWILWIWIAIIAFTDIFRRRDLSGWAKAAWVVLIVILPWIGVLIYLIANHDGLADRNEKQARASQSQFDEYVRRAAGTAGPASEIDTAKKLLDSGTITQGEFEAIKTRALGSGASA
jgi:hypothetical protein